MINHAIETIINHADQICRDAGRKLTQKRKNVLLCLLESKTPLSAYEVTAQYQQLHQETIQPMSVYRMLEFLMQAGLVHKLTSTSQYLACTHIACQHEHEAPQFLICNSCQRVQEIAVKQQVMSSLQKSVRHAGFTLSSPQLELHGLCAHCQV